MVSVSSVLRVARTTAFAVVESVCSTVIDSDALDQRLGHFHIAVEVGAHHVEGQEGILDLGVS